MFIFVFHLGYVRSIPADRCKIQRSNEYSKYYQNEEQKLAQAKVIHAQGVDLAYLQTGISSVFLGFEFRKSVFFWVLGIGTAFFGLINKCCILKYFIFSKIFLLGPVLLIRCFSKDRSSLILYHASLLLNELRLRRVFFRVLLLGKHLLGFLLVTKYFFGSFRNTQLR